MKIREKKRPWWQFALIWTLILGIPTTGFLVIRNNYKRWGMDLPGFPNFSEDGIPVLNLKIENDEWQKIIAVREKAFETGILVVNDDDWIKTQLEFEGKTAPASMRLKGDWIDHLKGKKWSFRISVKPPLAWNRLITFSVQSPETRDFLNEWVYHKLLDREGILTTRYDFMHLRLNGASRGLYAYEEHFEKQLPEYHKHREGPIIKYAEDALWNLRQVEALSGITFINGHRVVAAADIRPFKEARTLADTNLRAQFMIAQNLALGYKSRMGIVSETFDVERLALFYALTDLTRTYHGLIWHNHRYYYNPVTGLLEPVGFDGDTGGRFRELMNDKILGQGNGVDGMYIITNTMEDRQVWDAYIRHLKRLTEPAYLEEFFKEIDADLNFREKLIQKEFKEFTYDRTALADNATLIRGMIDDLKFLGEKKKP